jgi:hypothetical protein
MSKIFTKQFNFKHTCSYSGKIQYALLLFINYLVVNSLGAISVDLEHTRLCILATELMFNMEVN